MLDKLTIKNFRIFEDFNIEGLRRVNLIAGKNNTGKTTLLEWLRNLPATDSVFVPTFTMPQSLFEQPGREVMRQLSGEASAIVREIFEPNFKRVEVADGEMVVFFQDNTQWLPLESFGAGLQRIILLTFSLVRAKGKLLLIDGIETGLHFSVQEKLWAILFHYCREWDIQAFITTHSDDAIRTFFQEAAKPENKEDAFFFRLQFDRQGKLEAIPYDLDRLEHALEQQIEVR